MVGLDSLYAMLARPIQLSIKRKRLMVEEADNSASIAADDHETPQSEQSSLERRQSQEDRREGLFRGDRRSDSEKNEASERERKTSRDLAEHEAVNSPLPRIDIDI
ncbi:hypothetical protein FM037_26205 [Shewanella psychropiezotolerans]|uniref:Uncharacterized protein n=1 Tax=Shewanella psychropiezotolerans TaxID=2593655 RepID=A0ABX5X440_9GAMM|nr:MULTISPECIES: hypothetical protein [Shewanella]MPY26441.1 hypothetical protein [Shewanella sp. YLB-07]QDO86111.1 hypothetical protein FM037_26205 [Shewanella psychropiezotolerans]